MASFLEEVAALCACGPFCMLESRTVKLYIGFMQDWSG